MARTIRQGALVPDLRRGRMDIRFSTEDYYGGLHCGDTFEVLINDEWEPTRIEMGFDREWYLVGIECKDIVGLTVRI